MIVLAVWAVGCRSASTAPPAQQVQLTRAEPQNLPNAVTYQATVDAIDEIAMTPEIDGRIVAMPMREGQFVKAGTLLY